MDTTNLHLPTGQSVNDSTKTLLRTALVKKNFLLNRSKYQGTAVSFPLKATVKVGIFTKHQFQLFPLMSLDSGNNFSEILNLY